MYAKKQKLPATFIWSTTFINFQKFQSHHAYSLHHYRVVIRFATSENDLNSHPAPPPPSQSIQVVPLITNIDKQKLQKSFDHVQRLFQWHLITTFLLFIFSPGSLGEWGSGPSFHNAAFGIRIYRCRRQNEDSSVPSFR